MISWFKIPPGSLLRKRVFYNYFRKYECQASFSGSGYCKLHPRFLISNFRFKRFSQSSRRGDILEVLRGVDGGWWDVIRRGVMGWGVMGWGVMGWGVMGWGVGCKAVLHHNVNYSLVISGRTEKIS